ncbi:MAG: PDZ domain-containing protein [Planctomycetota bacterium]
MQAHRLSGVPIAFGAFLMVASGLTAQGHDPAPQHLEFSYVDDEHVSIVVDRAGDKVEVLIDGEPAPKDRFRRDGESIALFDSYGRQVATVSLHGAGGSLFTFPRAKPRLRLGVSLMPVPEALAAHLDVDAAETLYLSEVTSGQAAERAGLRQHDIITHIDGAAPVTRERLSEVLADKEPGDQLTVRVLRRGGAEEIDVELEAEEAGVAAWPNWATNNTVQPFEFRFPYTTDYAAPNSAFKAAQNFDASRLFNSYQDAATAYKLSPFLALDPYHVDRAFGGANGQEPAEGNLERLEQRLRALEELLEKLDSRLQDKG